MDLADRDRRRRHAESLLADLAARGVIGVATGFVDCSGIARVKTVPLERLPALAAWGVGSSPSFDFFRFDDWLAAPSCGEAPVGDLRVLPDLDRLVVLAAQPGWAWAPADRFTQDGSDHPRDARLLLARMVERLAARGLEARAAIEIEWAVSSEQDGDDFVPGVGGPAYGVARLVDSSAYCRDLLIALREQGIEVDQLHPEYAAGQLEVSVAAESPVHAADTSVLVRTTIRAVGADHGLRTSFSPKVDATGVGNGGHVHLSLTRDARALMSGGDGPCGLTREGEAFAAGVLDHLPGLLAIGAPSVASYLRLVPSHWAGVFRCWGLENREAALRMVTGSAGSEAWAANLEVKCVDLHANPYLLLAGLLGAGLDGLDRQARLPAPVTLREALGAFVADEVLTTTYGGPLVAALTAVRESEIELFAGASADEVAAASRWAH